jgi:truncated hemoglobin YjbI
MIKAVLLVCLFLDLSFALSVYTVSCGTGCSQNMSYTITQTAPVAGTPTQNELITCTYGETVVFNIDSTVNASYPFLIKTTNGTGNTNPAPTATNQTATSGPAQVNVTCGCPAVYYQCINYSPLGNGIVATNCTSATNPNPNPNPNPTAAPTICQKYAAAVTNGNQTALMYAIVNAVVTNEVSNSSIAPYFNGNIPAGSTNFLNTNNTAQLNELKAGLCAFFGTNLGCTDPSFVTYTGPSMAAVHQNMNINLAIFNDFNAIFIDTLANLQVTPADQATILSFLQSYQDAIVTASPGTPGTPTATPTGTPTATPTGTPPAMPTGTPTATPTGTPPAMPTGTPTAPSSSASRFSAVFFGLVAFFVILA